MVPWLQVIVIALKTEGHHDANFVTTGAIRTLIQYKDVILPV